MAIDQGLFRQVASSFNSGVTVITTGFEGAYHGMTASAFTSLSLEPTQVLVCVNRGTRALNLIENCGCFNVNILSAEQEGLSRIFASKDAPERDGLEGIAYTIGSLGVPLLDGSLAYFECRVVQQYDGGDHVIFVGDVEGAGIGTAEDPLVYYRGKYRRLAPQTQPSATPPLDSIFGSGWRKDVHTQWGGLPD